MEAEAGMRGPRDRQAEASGSTRARQVERGRKLAAAHGDEDKLILKLGADYVHPDVAAVAVDGDEAVEDDDLRCGHEAVDRRVRNVRRARARARASTSRAEAEAVAAVAGQAGAPSVLALVRMVLSASFFSKANSSVALAKLDL